jgi:HlyD family secretion protein
MTSDIRCGGLVAAQRKSKRIWVWGGVLAVVAAAGLVFLGMHRGGPHFEPSRLDKVTRGEIDQSVVATGKVQPITKIELKSKASGIVQNLYVDINQHVHKGSCWPSLTGRRSWPRSMPNALRCRLRKLT